MTSTQGPSNGSPKSPWDSVLDALGPILDSVKDYVGDQFAAPANRPQAPKERDLVADLSKIIIAAAGRQVTGDAAELIKKTITDLINNVRNEKSLQTDMSGADTTPDLRDVARIFIAKTAIADPNLVPKNGTDLFNALFDPSDRIRRTMALAYLVQDPALTGDLVKGFLKELSKRETFSGLDSFTQTAYIDIVNMLRFNPGIISKDPKALKQVNFKNSSPGVIAKLVQEGCLDPQDVWNSFVIKNIPRTEAIPLDSVDSALVTNTIADKWPFVKDLLSVDLSLTNSSTATFDVAR